jgi:hypothetical protein
MWFLARAGGPAAARAPSFPGPLRCPRRASQITSKTSVRGDWTRLDRAISSLKAATIMRTHRSRVASWILAVFFAGSLPLAALVSRDARAQEKETPTLGTIERLDPRLDPIVPRDARVERLAEGFDWSEGPVWDRRGGFLLFSDVPLNTDF